MNKILLKNKNSGKIFEFIANFNMFNDFSYQLLEISYPIKYIEFYCGRPSVLGNEYSWKENTLAKFKVNSSKESIDKFKLYQLPRLKNEIDKIKEILINNNICLTCWCVPKTCHCIEIAKKLL